MIEKTNKRKRLEELEDEIHKAWLHDLDRVKEIIEIKEILFEMLASDSLETYFNSNVSDMQYFLKKFSNEVISNLLRQHYVYGENGDDQALEVLKTYLRLFLKHIENPEYAALFENVKEIFDATKSYYRGLGYGTNRTQNEKKLITNEFYNVNIF